MTNVNTVIHVLPIRDSNSRLFRCDEKYFSDSYYHVFKIRKLPIRFCSKRILSTERKAEVIHVLKHRIWNQLSHRPV